LTDEDEAFAKEHGALPKARCALYGGNGAVAHDLRKSLWDLGVCVRETSGDVSNWVDSIGAWPNPDDEFVDADVDAVQADAGEDKDKDAVAGGAAAASAAASAAEFDPDDLPPVGASPVLGRQLSAGDMRLEYCRKRLGAVEEEQQRLDAMDEDQRKGLASRGQALFAKLSASVDARHRELDLCLAEVRAALAAAGYAGAGGAGGKHAADGARSGRNAALAEAWWGGLKEVDVAGQAPSLAPADGADKSGGRLVRRAARCVRWLEAEKESLRQVALAGKVVSCIPSPEQIKYLNLTHDWLRTYLPVP
jgi:hypothetical protein